MIYVLNVDTCILQANNKRLSDIFMTKHKSGVVKYCGKDMERFQLFFEAAEAGKLAESILIFNDIIVMSGNEKVCTYFLR